MRDGLSDRHPTPLAALLAVECRARRQLNQTADGGCLLGGAVVADRRCFDAVRWVGAFELLRLNTGVARALDACARVSRAAGALARCITRRHLTLIPNARCIPQPDHVPRRAGWAPGGVGRRSDVREVFRAVKSARASEPELDATDVVPLVESNTGVPARSIDVAVRYWSSYPDEIDAWMVETEAVEAEALAAWERQQQLLAP